MEPITQLNPDLKQALADYQQALSALNTYFAGHDQPDQAPTTPPTPVVRLVWELLHRRDRLEVALQTMTGQSTLLSLNRWTQKWHHFRNHKKATPTLKTAIQQADDRLKKLVPKIQTTVDLAALRITAQPLPTAWWWFLDLNEPLPWWSQYDWLWNSFSFVSLTAAFNLFLGVSNKLLAAGPDALGLLVITQGILPLLAGGSALTTQGKETIQKALIHWRIPKYLWAEVSSVLAVTVFLLALGLRSLVPVFSAYYENAGYEDFQKGQLSSAEENFGRAIKLDPNNFQANYQLGNLYRDLQDSEQALTNYKVALKGGISQAYDDIIGIYLANKQYAEADNWLWRQLQTKYLATDGTNVLTQKQYQALTTLARVYLQRGSYSEAIRWIDLGIRQTQENPNRQYTLLTYLGWVRLLQTERDSEAEAYLQQAINLDMQQLQQSQYKIDELQKVRPQSNFRLLEHKPRPAAYCLMAQVRQKQGKPQQERENWEQCLAWASQTNPDEDNWISIARKRLKVIDNAP